MPKLLNEEYELVALNRLRPHERNVNQGDYGAIQESVQANGFFGALVVQRSTGKILAGNHRYEVAKQEGFDALPVTWVDVDDETALRILLADNRTARLGSDNEAGLAELLAELAATDKGLAGTGYAPEELDDLLAGLNNPLAFSPPEGTETDGNRAADFLPPLDIVWPSDNDLQIPALLPALQADCLTAPFVLYGAKARQTNGGTVGFYTDDYRFDALWKTPDTILSAGFRAALEPNWSVHDIAPRALAVWQTYRKRWIARYWQENGVRVFVDLNVSEHHADVNLLGVPQGWNAYATRGYTARLDATFREYERAQTLSGIDAPLFVVYGGGRKVAEAARDNGWVHVPEEMNAMKTNG